MLTIPPGRTNISLAVSVVDDREEEPDERMQLDLVSIMGAASVSALNETVVVSASAHGTALQLESFCCTALVTASPPRAIP